MTLSEAMRPFDRLVGNWTSEATHPMMPGTVVRGSTTIEWFEGGRFLIVRGHYDHPDFPDAISILGNLASQHVDEATGKPVHDDATKLTMQYYDERGVYRQFDTSMRDGVWRLESNVRGFSQRAENVLSNDGNTIEGQWQLRRDDVHWEDDLKIVYFRSG